jgi:hypothetical protein
LILLKATVQNKLLGTLVELKWSLLFWISNDP